MDDLIGALVADLHPVRKLARPLFRALAWGGAVLLLGALVMPFVDMHAVATRLMSEPDLWVAAVAEALTALFAAIAAFELSLPDRSPRWGLLPVPALALWIGASGLGCLRSFVVPGLHDASVAESMNCIVFIVGFSFPLSALMVFMLRRGFSLRPSLTGAMAGLAAAAAAALLLNLNHPFDASVSDLSIHGLAIGMVILANRLTGGRLLASKT
jgi:hypothetical protein